MSAPHTNYFMSNYIYFFLENLITKMCITLSILIQFLSFLDEYRIVFFNKSFESIHIGLCNIHVKKNTYIYTAQIYIF